MIEDDDLHVRLGRVRDGGQGSAHRAKPFIARALAAAEKAGGLQRRPRRRSRSAAFGRGRAASIVAARLMTDRTRSVAVKARVVRHRGRGAPLGTHMAYLRREGVTKDGAPGRMFDAGHDDAYHRAFAGRSEADRHHFRFIVSPQDAEQLSDLRAFTRDLMAQAERTFAGPARLRGISGSGKTVVALHRARRLAKAALDKDERILFTTFDKGLAAAAGLDSLCGQERASIEVTHLHR
jgi:hypothetical protein